jgi:hypothetical protein
MNISTLCPAAKLMLAGLLALSSCSKENPSGPTKAGTTAAAPKYTKVEDVPASERQELDAFGRELEKHLKAKDLEAVKETFYVSGMVDLVMDGVNASGSNVDKFKTGMGKGLNQSLGFIAKNWSENEVKYKHIVIHDGRAKVRFRLASDTSGITMLDILVKKRPDGSMGMVDFYNHAVGSGMVDQGKQNALPILAELDKGFLERVFGGSSPEISLKDSKTCAEMSQGIQKGNYQAAIDGYHKLSPEMQRKTLPTVLHLTALQNTRDDEAYKTALKEAAKSQDSASFQFMLIDLYVLEEDHAKAIECLDNFMAAVERDAALLAIKALLLQNNGSTEAAREVVREAFALEPDSIFVHNKSLDVLLAAKDYAAVAQSIRFLESNGDYEFKGALTDPVWADFVKSPESAPWR